MQFCSVPNCKYPNFGIDKVTRLPYCRNHQTMRTDFDRRTILHKAMDKQKALSTQIRGLQDSPENKEMLIDKGIIEDENLELYFKLAAIELAKSPWCQECNAFIGLPKNTYADGYKSSMTIETIYRNSTAHILPKRKDYGFPSVRAHPKNKLFLCTINGCHDKTHTWSKFAKMKVWPLAVAAFKEIYPFIAEDEHKHIPDIFRQFIPEQNLNVQDLTQTKEPLQQ